MIDVQKNYPDNLEINPELLKEAIKLTLQCLEKPEMDVTLRLTSDAELRQLNQTFRGIASPTDVLAFTQETIDPETNRLYLGDIVISTDRAMQQAQERGHTLNNEIAFLAIHGVLHLFGYDHDNPEQKREMWERQADIFKKFTNKYGGNPE